MNPILRAIFLSLSVMMIGLSGCSGGGGSGPAAANMVTGVAATGAPVSGLVLLRDSATPSAVLTANTASDGSFAFNTAGMTPPFLIKVPAGNTNLYSLASGNGIVNVTPLTTMAVAQAAGGADLDMLFTNHVKADIVAAASNMPAAVQAVQQSLAPLMDQFGVTGNILTSQFSANHTGIDAMMDAITVNLSGGTVTIINKQNGATIFSAPAANLASGALVGTLPVPAAQTPGAALYTAKCAGCHGALANTNLKGRATIAAVQDAIAFNLGGMSILARMPAPDIQSIIDAIAAQPATSTPAGTGNATTTPPGATPDGAALYAANCSRCHGPLGSSSKTGATVVRIQNAISGGVGGMDTLAGLTAADIQAISAALNPAGSTPAPVPSPTPSPSPSTTPSGAPDGAALYNANCAGCHGALASSTKQGITLARLQTAISNNMGGMGSFASLNTAQQQAIVDALASTAPAPAPAPGPAPSPTPAPSPSPAPDGAALYTTNCAGCHGALATSTKQGITIARLQNAIASNTGGMGGLSRLTVTEIQAIVTALNPSTPTPTPAPTPSPAPTPTPTPTPGLDGAALYAANCQGCHGPLATSAKIGATLARLQNAITSNVGGMGTLSALSAAEQQAIITALTPAAPTPSPTPSPTPAPAPDGATLYTTNCAGCHGALATSAKAGATVTRIQGAITANTGGMGYLSTTLSSADITAIAGALATVTPSPTPTPACGSCHAIPPATGHHSTHKNEGIGCATCHGSGYSNTSFNAATHNNGVVNLTSTIGWNATSRSCSNSCHGRHTW